MVDMVVVVVVEVVDIETNFNIFFQTFAFCNVEVMSKNMVTCTNKKVCLCDIW